MASTTFASPGEAARVACDLKKDLAHLRRRGVDPATFFGGTLARIARYADQASR